MLTALIRTVRTNLDELCVSNAVYITFSAFQTSNSVKLKVKVKVTLEQATKAQRGRGGIALLFL